VGAPRTGTALQTYWPPNRGFLETPVTEKLGVGTRIDRYGDDTGTFFAPQGTPYWMRSLPAWIADTKPYNVYEVIRPIEVQSGKAAPWFGQFGQGTQYEFPLKVVDGITQRLYQEGWAVDAICEENIRSDAFHIGNTGDECFVLSESGYDWRVYYSERGLERKARHFITESEALQYLLEELQAQKRRGLG
jgi:hypothetical protein